MATEPATSAQPPSPVHQLGRADLGKFALAIAIGTAGGAIFSYLDLPLPWMMGAMFATGVSSLGGAKLKMDSRLRTLMILVLGVLLGGAFSPEIIQIKLGTMYAAGRGVAHDAAKAQKWYRKAADQGHPGGQNSLAWFYAERGDNLDEAESLIRKALQTDPTSEYYWDTLATILHKKGDAAGAKSAWDNAIMMAPADNKQNFRQAARKYGYQ